MHIKKSYSHTKEAVDRRPRRVSPIQDILAGGRKRQGLWAKKPEGMKSFEHFARITLRPGDTNNLHTHKDAEQVYFVMQGEGVIQVGEERENVSAGDVVFLPAKVQHGFFNTGDKQAIVYLIGVKV